MLCDIYSYLEYITHYSYNNWFCWLTFKQKVLVKREQHKACQTISKALRMNQREMWVMKINEGWQQYGVFHCYFLYNESSYLLHNYLCTRVYLIHFRAHHGKPTVMYAFCFSVCLCMPEAIQTAWDSLTGASCQPTATMRRATEQCNLPLISVPYWFGAEEHRDWRCRLHAPQPYSICFISAIMKAFLWLIDMFPMGK